MLGSDENPNNLHKQAWNRHQKVILNTDSLPIREESLNDSCKVCINKRHLKYAKEKVSLFTPSDGGIPQWETNRKNSSAWSECCKHKDPWKTESVWWN